MPPPLACPISYCGLWATTASLFCHAHHNRWVRHGRPGTAEFIAGCEDPGPGIEHISLRLLPAQLRLEVAYVLQCRHGEQTARLVPATIQDIIRGLAATGAASFLDRPEHDWKRFGQAVSGGCRPGWRAFALDACQRIDALAHGTGWDVEYPRDLWRLRALGIQGRTATLDFTKISQGWLKDLAKRWARWQLSIGLTGGTASDGIRAITRFSVFASASPSPVTGLARIDRPLLERYLANLNTERAGRSGHGAYIGSLDSFFTAIRQHCWDGTLPTTAMFFAEDYPKAAAKLPRALAGHVMAQVEQPASLERWHDPAHRVITLILIRCGLRVSDATRLPFDCLVTGPDNAPYLRYFNHKMKREALVPVDDELGQQIRGQQQRALSRWPDGVPVLFPRSNANLSGHEPIASGTYRLTLYKWLARCDIRDEHGRPAHLTPHQWRHTLVISPAFSTRGTAKPGLAASCLTSIRYSVRHVRQGRYQSLSLFAAAFDLTWLTCLSSRNGIYQRLLKIQYR